MNDLLWWQTCFNPFFLPTRLGPSVGNRGFWVGGDACSSQKTQTPQFSRFCYEYGLVSISINLFPSELTFISRNLSCNIIRVNLIFNNNKLILWCFSLDKTLFCGGNLFFFYPLFHSTRLRPPWELGFLVGETPDPKKTQNTQFSNKRPLI